MALTVSAVVVLLEKLHALDNGVAEATVLDRDLVLDAVFGVLFTPGAAVGGHQDQEWVLQPISAVDHVIHQRLQHVFLQARSDWRPVVPRWLRGQNLFDFIAHYAGAGHGLVHETQVDASLVGYGEIGDFGDALDKTALSRPTILAVTWPVVAH